MPQYISLTKSYENKRITIQDLYSLYGASRDQYGVLLLVNESEIFDNPEAAPTGVSSWLYDNPSSLIVYRFDIFRLAATTLGSTVETQFYYDTDENAFRRNIDGVAVEFSGAELWAARADETAVPDIGYIAETESVYTPNDIPLYHEIKTLRKTWFATECTASDATIIKHEKAIIAVDAHFNDGNYDRVAKILEFYNEN